MFIPVLLLTTAALAAPATWGPTWSEVTGARYHKAIMNRYPAIINMVGDQGVLRASYSVPFKTEPGTFDIVVQSPPHNGFDGSTKTMRLELAPCKMYWINVQFKNRISPEWEPVVDYVDSVAGCKPETAKQ
jgi:hypothetical protein